MTQNAWLWVGLISLIICGALGTFLFMYVRDAQRTRQLLREAAEEGLRTISERDRLTEALRVCDSIRIEKDGSKLWLPNAPQNRRMALASYEGGARITTLPAGAEFQLFSAAQLNAYATQTPVVDLHSRRAGDAAQAG